MQSLDQSSRDPLGFSLSKSGVPIPNNNTLDGSVIRHQPMPSAYSNNPTASSENPADERPINASGKYNLNDFGISTKFENLALGDSDYGSEDYSDDFEDEIDDESP